MKRLRPAAMLLCIRAEFRASPPVIRPDAIGLSDLSIHLRNSDPTIAYRFILGGITKFAASASNMPLPQNA